MYILLNKWRLDPSLNALVHSETGEIQRLGEFHYILLETLVNHAGEVLSRNFLINAVWKNRVVGNNSLPTAIYALRAALGDDGRLQEIIKTVPKKGYVFNRDFILFVHATPVAEAPADRDNTAGLPEEAPLPAPKRGWRGKISGKAIVISIGIIAMLFLSIKYYLHLAQDNHGMGPPAGLPGLTLKDETRGDYSHIKIFHLHADANTGHEAQLVKYMPDALRSINMMLQAQRMNAVFYYTESVAKLSMSFMVQDSCHNQYQLMLSIQNWQSNLQNLNSAVYQATEKTINEIPTCQ